MFILALEKVSPILTDWQQQACSLHRPDFQWIQSDRIGSCTIAFRLMLFLYMFVFRTHLLFKWRQMVLTTYITSRYEELLDVSVPRPKTLQIHTSTTYIILITRTVSRYDHYYCFVCSQPSPAHPAESLILTYNVILGTTVLLKEWLIQFNN